MNETERLASLLTLDLLDTPAEKEYDDLVKLASTICRTPISLVSLVDRERQWFKAAVGLSVKETHRDVSFCAHAIQQPHLFMVEDATRDARFSNNALVTQDPSIRFYAGVPLCAPGGAPVGTLCVIDTVPRTLTEDQKDALTILGSQVQARMELRARQKALELLLGANEELSASLQQTNSLFQSFMNYGPFASYIKAGDGTMIFYNRFLAQVSGVSEQAWLGRKDHEIWAADLAAKFREDDLAVLEGNVPVETEDISPAADGSTVHWKNIKFPYRSPSGDAMLAGISIDVTEGVKRDAELQKAFQEKSVLAEQLAMGQHRFRSFLQHIPTQTFVKDDQGRFVFYNQAVCRFFGIGDQDWLGKTVFDVVPELQATAFAEQDQQVWASSETLETVSQLADKDGMLHSFKSTKFPYNDFNGQVMIAEIAQDITEELSQAAAMAELTAELERLATTDSLTGLATRRVFESRMEIAYEDWRRKRLPFSVIVMDVDNFKQRNDTYGHIAGDDALRVIGTLLRDCVRVADVACRLGGEEFGVLLPNTTLEGAMDLATRFQALLGQEKEDRLPLTVSIGIHSATPGDTGWVGVLGKTDEAMYAAKKSGKNRICTADSGAVFASMRARNGGGGSKML